MKWTENAEAVAAERREQKTIMRHHDANQPTDYGIAAQELKNMDIFPCTPGPRVARIIQQAVDLLNQRDAELRHPNPEIDPLFSDESGDGWTKGY